MISARPQTEAMSSSRPDRALAVRREIRDAIEHFRRQRNALARAAQLAVSGIEHEVAEAEFPGAHAKA